MKTNISRKWRREKFVVVTRHKPEASIHTPHELGLLYLPMALRQQPYLPLYIQDFLTDEKLLECSAAATGVYIRLMCVMHKSERYGSILLKQKDKQSAEQIKNFASKLVRSLGFSEPVIYSALQELITEDVIQINGDYLEQRRMIADCLLSEIRAKAGRQGGAKAKTEQIPINSFDKGFAIAKSEANAEYENEYENEDKIKNKEPEFTMKWPEHLCCSPEFMEAWDKLCKSKKWKKKSPDALQASVNKLRPFDAVFATELVNSAIAGEYQGVVFSDTKEKYLKYKNQNHGNTNRNGEAIIAGRITKNGAEALLEAAIIRENRAKHPGSNNGSSIPNSPAFSQD
jgi:hypothetical protein